MKGWLIRGSIVLLPLAAAVQASDRFGSAACRDALMQLQRIEETRRAERRATDVGAGPRVEQARRTAAARCLGPGAEAEGSPPARSSPPVSVAPVAPPPPLDGPRIAPPAAMPSAPDIVNRPPVTVTRCDSAGCWTSDGRFLMRIGPELVGPAASCSVQAGVLQCR